MEQILFQKKEGIEKNGHGLVLIPYKLSCHFLVHLFSQLGGKIMFNWIDWF